MECLTNGQLNGALQCALGECFDESSSTCVGCENVQCEGKSEPCTYSTYAGTVLPSTCTKLYITPIVLAFVETKCLNEI